MVIPLCVGPAEQNVPSTTSCIRGRCGIIPDGQPLVAGITGGARSATIEVQFCRYVTRGNRSGFGRTKNGTAGERHARRPFAERDSFRSVPGRRRLMAGVIDSCAGSLRLDDVACHQFFKKLGKAFFMVRLDDSLGDRHNF